MSCLIAWWQESGCALNGDWSPLVDDYNVEYFSGLNVDQMKYETSRVFESATNGEAFYELKCFGQ